MTTTTQDHTAAVLAGAVTDAERAQRAADAAYTDAQRATYAAETARSDAAAAAQRTRFELRAYVRAVIHAADPVIIEPPDAVGHWRDRTNYRATFGSSYAMSEQSTPGYSAKPKPRHVIAGAHWTEPAPDANDRYSAERTTQHRADLYDSGRGTSDRAKIDAALVTANAAAAAWAQDYTAAAYLARLGITRAPDPLDILTATPKPTVQGYGWTERQYSWSVEWSIATAGAHVGDLPAYDLPEPERAALYAALDACPVGGPGTRDEADAAALAAVQDYTAAALAAWIAKQ